MVILNNKPKYFFQTRWFRAALIVVGVIVVIAIVVFNKQISDLFNFFGSRASTQTHVDWNQSNFLPAENQSPSDTFRVVGGRLQLNNPGQ